MKTIVVLTILSIFARSASGTYNVKEPIYTDYIYVVTNVVSKLIIVNEIMTLL